MNGKNEGCREGTKEVISPANETVLLWLPLVILFSFTSSLLCTQKGTVIVFAAPPPSSCTPATPAQRPHISFWTTTDSSNSTHSFSPPDAPPPPTQFCTSEEKITLVSAESAHQILILVSEFGGFTPPPCRLPPSANDTRLLE